MQLRKRVSEPWFTLISAGVKQVEGRLDKGDFSRIQTGDVIVWENDELGFTRTCRTRVDGRAQYPGFRAYLQKEHLSRCLPAAGIRTIAQGVRVYHRYYSAEDEMRYGVVALRLSLDDGGTARTHT
jgi:ASC-1-like (ASCH) protein